jgi:hypothetical protein
LVSEDIEDEYGKYCIKCVKVYTDVDNKWCKSCQINHLRKNFTSSGNEKIDDFIQKRQLEINSPLDIVFEWIPYHQFFDIKKIDENNFYTLYLSKWKNGPLNWDKGSKEYVKHLDKEVTLKCLQNIDELLNEV